MEMSEMMQQRRIAQTWPASRDYSRARTVKEQSPATDTAICFGRFCLMVRQRRLERDGSPIIIGCRALDLLIVLVECAGTVLSKRDLMARAWPHVIVDKPDLRVEVSGLRKALGQQCIATVQGRGYTFVAPLRLREATHFTAVGPEPPRLIQLGRQD
jgi:DNA-binding winged helix-turn-helix (wHTH) protein